MLSRFKPEHRRVIVVFGSLWAVAVVFVIVRALAAG